MCQNVVYRQFHDSSEEGLRLEIGDRERGAWIARQYDTTHKNQSRQPNQRLPLEQYHGIILSIKRSSSRDRQCIRFGGGGNHGGGIIFCLGDSPVTS